MSSWNKWLWGGLGWTIGGPIGGIIGFALGAITEKPIQKRRGRPPSTQPGDFGTVLLILCASLMKADNRVLKSELDFVKNFIVTQFGSTYASQRLKLLQQILKQDYDIIPVCYQIKTHLDYASRLELLHLLYGLALSDGHFHAQEKQFIDKVASFIGIRSADQISIRAMFVKRQTPTSAYKILEIPENASVDEIKKAYRKMAKKYHPDKLHHLGPEFQKDAQEKFKKVSDAYDKLKKQKGFN
ncbi:MAG: TerB family tellurite resistance protein [Bacteroidia bacterium]|nr:TerB family tellurite resistance protein [Bacteroidia bacterium]